MSQVSTPALLEHGSIERLRSDERSAARARPASRPDDLGFNDILSEATRQCGACALLAHWHPADGAALLLSSIALEPRAVDDFAAYRAEAITAATRSGPVRLAVSGHHTVASDRCATAVLMLDDGVVTLTAIAEYPGPRVERIRASLERLLPFLAAYFGQWRGTQRLLARLQSFTEAVEGSGMATILLGSDTQIVFANNAAECVLAEGDGLRRNGERLACTKLADTLRLQAVTSHFLAEAGNGSGFNPVLAVPRAKRRPLTIAMTATRGGGLALPDEVRAIAYIFDPEQDMTAIVEPVCRLHGLSHSETRLTCALVGGESLGCAAKIIGVREQTARSYLKQIFAKTETNRQAELVQLMLKSAARLSSSGETRACF